MDCDGWSVMVGCSGEMYGWSGGMDGWSGMDVCLLWGYE